MFVYVNICLLACVGVCVYFVAVWQLQYLRVCLTSHIGFSLLQMKSQILALLQQQQGFSTLLRLMYRMANIDKQLQLTAAKVDAMRSEIIVEWRE